MSDSDSLEKGKAIMARLRGTEASPPSPSEELFPDMREMSVKHLFGEVWSRPGLALRDRSMITVAVLMALARTEELKFHMRGALNNGVSREELLEMIMHISHYAGWPTGASAMRVAKEIFSQQT